ncbi:MAG: ATP-binding protein [Gammaproteobacteria bacterium]
MKPTEIINRTLKNSLKQLATTYPIVALMGPRQSGKTTLAKLTFPNFKYVTLEDLDTRTYAQEDPRDFLLYYSNGAIIDEIQRVPTLFSYIQTHVDKTNKVGQFILTGSQNFLLLEKITQSLAGRVALLKLLPLDLNELQKADFALESIQLEKLLFKGFYPKIHASNLSSTIWYSNYIQTYLERDVRTIKNIHDLSQFQLFLKMCAHRAGQLLNLSELGNECGINHNTVQGWLSILEASFIVYRLCPYYVNFNKRLTKMPKLYFYDTGLLCNLLNIQEASQISVHSYKGMIFENFVITDLIKQQLHNNTIIPFYFWRDKLGNEIDCVIEKFNDLILIEIKSGKTIANDFFKGLRYWDKISDQKNYRKYLVYGGKENQKREIVNIIGWNNIVSIV